MQFYTPGVLQYGNIWFKTPEVQNAFIFSVQACEDVHLGLSSEPSSSTGSMYEILIGGMYNTHVAIRKPQQVCTAVLVA